MDLKIHSTKKGVTSHDELTDVSSDDHHAQSHAIASHSDTIDHGSINGLGDDDHAQYVLDDILTTKGDIFAASGVSTPLRLGVGADDEVLTADSNEPTGVKWAIPSGGATIELDNLGTVAINTSLISDTDSTDDLGSSDKFWANLFVDKIFISTSKSQTDVSISGFATTQTRHQGILVENQAGYAYLFLSGDVGGGSDAGQIHFGSANFPDAASLVVFNDDLTIGVSDASGKLILSQFGHQIEFTTTGQDKFSPITDSAIDLGSSTRFWNANFTDELILTNVGARSSSADKLVLSAIDLSAGNTILDMNTEGTGVTGSGTPTADRTVAIRVNGTVLYLIASTVAN